VFFGWKSIASFIHLSSSIVWPISVGIVVHRLKLLLFVWLLLLGFREDTFAVLGGLSRVQTRGASSNAHRKGEDQRGNCSSEDTEHTDGRPEPDSHPTFQIACWLFLLSHSVEEPFDAGAIGEEGEVDLFTLILASCLAFFIGGREVPGSTCADLAVEELVGGADGLCRLLGPCLHQQQCKQVQGCPALGHPSAKHG